MRNLMIVIALTFAGCATQAVGGLSRPGLLTNPESYLETVGLDSHTKADVLNVVGTPTSSASAEGRDYWTYQLADDGARARYTYIFSGDTLVDVRYNQDKGSYGYDGMTAKRKQGR